MIESFAVGTGASIYSQRLLPAILSARLEVILVTCFWAPSKTLTALSSTLEQLAERRQLQQPEGSRAQPLRLRICFSSRSLFQKLLHTSSSDGYVYPPSTWTRTLGLPSPETLAAGNMDLQVKSLFFLPFSVMHPKFLIVDRQRVFVPSCNVSWEPWLEGCLELARPAPPAALDRDPINDLLEFYRQVWDKSLDLTISLPEPTDEETGIQPSTETRIASPVDATVSVSGVGVPSTAIQWLPSWHRRNPGFCLFPWQTPKVPDTPLNMAVLRLFEASSRHVYMQTPNLTAPPVLSAITDALARGVQVHVVTGRNMMLWEQLLTAFTTTGRCIKKLTQTYKRLCESVEERTPSPSQPASVVAVDLEAQTITPGALTISYFTPSTASTLDEEPVQSHLKLTIFDGEKTVLGSGNMDRASWFTSQELGILIQDVTFARTVKEIVDKALEGRLEHVFSTP